MTITMHGVSKRLEEKLEIKTKSQNPRPSSKFETKVTGE
jgi:hypothetical protein